MKLSANSLGIFAFTAITTVAFVWMAKRPPVEENQIMQFGMPLQTTTERTNDKPELVNEKSIEGSSSAEEPTSSDGGGDGSSTAADSSSTADDPATANGSSTADGAPVAEEPAPSKSKKAEDNTDKKPD